jgi:hypothetical protein
MKSRITARSVLVASIAATLLAGVILATSTLGGFGTDAQVGAVGWPGGGLTPGLIALGALLLLAAELAHASRTRLRHRVAQVIRTREPRAPIGPRPLHR